MKLGSTFSRIYKVTTVLQIALLLWAASIIRNSEGLDGLIAGVPLMGYQVLWAINVSGLIAYIVLVVKKLLRLDLVLVLLFATSVGSLGFFDPIFRDSDLESDNTITTQTPACSLDNMKTPNANEFTPKQLGC